MRAAFSGCFAIACLASGVVAQTYDDLRLVRRRPPEFSSALELRVGAGMSIPSNEDAANGFESDTALDGHIWYHNERFSAQEAALDLYAGRDGAVLSMRQNNPNGSVTRIELDTRYAPFYREGFYRTGDFIPSARYEGFDWGGYVGFGRIAGDGLHVEIGPYFRDLSFDRNETTPTSYVMPDDHRVYGIRTFAEHNTLQLDRQTGRPSDGFILTLRIDAERNDSDDRFGTPSFMSRLPSGLWRGRAHLEWYLPQRDLGTWTIRVDGNWSDEDDRISNYDAQTPIGHMWADGDLGVRWDFGKLSVEPFASLQWVKALTEDGSQSEEDFFFGGGGHVRFDVADSLSLYADYSFLDNPSRHPVSTTMDTLGEHQLFVGVELRVGANRY